jgi:hypothetical protein
MEDNAQGGENGIIASCDDGAKPKKLPWLSAHQWKKGQSGNPGGKFKKKTAAQIGAEWHKLVKKGREIRLQDKLEVLDASIAIWREEMVEGNSRDRLKAATDACEALGLKTSQASQHQHLHAFAPETEARIAARIAASLDPARLSAPPALLLAQAVVTESADGPAEEKHSFAPAPRTRPAPRPRRGKSGTIQRSCEVQ